jgi:hypothetical protein
MALMNGNNFDGIWEATIPPSSIGEVTYVVMANTTMGDSISTPICYMEIINSSVPEITSNLSLTLIVAFTMLLIANFYNRRK